MKQSDLQLIAEAKDLIEHMNKAFQESKRGLDAERRIQENLDDVLKKLYKSTKLDNTVLIALEKFYQSTSMTIGLSHVQLNQETQKAWKAYDNFHFDRVKAELKLYGPTVIL